MAVNKSQAADDPFEDVTSGFVKMDDLEDRLLLIAPKELKEMPSTIKGATAGSTYVAVVSDVVVLDGALTETIDEVPFTLEEFHLAGQVIEGQLRGAVRKGTMKLGRLIKTASQYKTSRWELRPATDEDKALARPAAAAYLKSQPDPFEG